MREKVMKSYRPPFQREALICLSVCGAYALWLAYAAWVML